MKYHIMYEGKIDERAVAEVKTIITKGLFKEKNVPNRKPFIQNLHEKLCSVYELHPIKVVFVDNFLGYGGYNKLTNEITLNKPSLVTYLFCFGSYLFDKKPELSNSSDLFDMGNIDSIDKAKGFALSLYYQATPHLCETAINCGMILFQTNMDGIDPEPVESDNIDDIDGTNEDN